MAVHGSLQHARIKATALRYRVRPNGCGWCATVECPTGSSIVGTFATEEDAQDWLMDKLPRPAITPGDIRRAEA